MGLPATPSTTTGPPSWVFMYTKPRFRKKNVSLDQNVAVQLSLGFILMVSCDQIVAAIFTENNAILCRNWA
jgi:hypothetical protein